MNKSVDRRYLWQYVIKKINRSIHHAHVMSVINILLDEVMGELIVSKKIKIGNFGNFILKKMKPRKHFNLVSKQYEMSKGNNIIRFELSKKIRDFLIKKLDIDQTFSETKNE